MKTLKFRVLKKDIENGVRYDPSSCPIAQCISRKFNGLVEVRPERIYIGKQMFRTPKECRDFIRNFDARQDVKSFSFVLELPYC